MSVLNQVLSGLHETDKKLKNKIQYNYNCIGLSSIQKYDPNDDSTIVPILNSEGLINPTYNSTKIASTGVNGAVDNTGIDQLSKIKFIGNCFVKDNADGTLTIRIGDNLNSAPFNTTDGQTDGTASYTFKTLKTSILNDSTKKTNVAVKNSNDTITITTAQKIHFDADDATFKLLVQTGAGDTEYTFGPLSGNGYYASNAGSTGSAPSVPAYVRITNFGPETKTADGATGNEANVTFTIDVDALATSDGLVSFKVVPLSGQDGAAAYPTGDDAYITTCYYITDNATTPTVSDVKAILPVVSELTTQTWAGITSFKAGTVTYKAIFDDLKNPGTDASNGASIKFDNNADFAGDIAKAVQQTYTGEITKTTTSWGNNGAYTNLTNKIVATGWNINGSTSASGNVYESNGTTVATAFDIYVGSPNSSITTNRKNADGTDYDSISNAAPGELMIYHGALQKPVTNVTSSFVGCSTYVKPTGDSDLSALFRFDADGTEPGGTLTINGANLTNGIVSIKLGNSIAKLANVRIGGGTNIGTTKSESDTQLVYNYTFQQSTDYVTSSTGCWVEIVYSNNTSAKITSIVRS